MRLKKMAVLILFTALLLLSGYEFFSKLPIGNRSKTAEALFTAGMEATTAAQPNPKPPRVDYQDILSTGDGPH